jgi:hypothetical protein
MILRVKSGTIHHVVYGRTIWTLCYLTPLASVSWSFRKQGRHREPVAYVCK